MTFADNMPAPAAEPKPWSHWGYDPETPWGPWSALAIGAVVLLIALIAVFVGTIAAAMLTGATISPADAEGVRAPEVLALGMWGMLAGQIAAIAATLLVATFKGGRLAAVLALEPPRRGVLAYVGGMAIFLATTVAAGLLINFVLPHDQLEDLRQLAPVVHSSIWPVTLTCVTAGAALSEELLFRGFLFSALLRTPLGLTGTAVVTSVLWSLLHLSYSYQGVLLIFCLGLGLSAIMVRFGSIRVPIICHALYNAMCFLYLKYALDPTTLTPAPVASALGWQ